MPVRDWMSKDLITIDEDASIMKASKLMKQNNIQHLVVLRKGRLVGIVSDRDLKEAQPSKATTLDIHEMYAMLDKITVKSLMPKKLFTITPGETLEKAAGLMLKHNISALPVTDPRGTLAGVISKGDIFRAFVSMSGIYQAELALGFEVEDRSGAIGEVTAVIRDHDGRIVSILSGYERSPKGFLEVFIRAKDVSDEEALRKDLESKFKVTYWIHDKVD